MLATKFQLEKEFLDVPDNIIFQNTAFSNTKSFKVKITYTYPSFGILYK